MSFDEELFGLAMEFANSPELPALKKRFQGFGACKDMATAAAFGYLAAMKEVEAKEEEPSIGDQVHSTILQALAGKINTEYTNKLIMGLVYQWLHKKMEEEDFDRDDYCMTSIKNLFAPFVRSGVIKGIIL